MCRFVHCCCNCAATRTSARWKKHDEHARAAHRQLRLVHVQHLPVHGPTRRRCGGEAQRPDHAGRDPPNEPGPHHDFTRTGLPQGRGRVVRRHPRVRRQNPHRRRVLGPPVHVRGLRRQSGPRWRDRARQSVRYGARRQGTVQGHVARVQGHPLPLARRAARDAARCARGDGHGEGYQHDHGRAAQAAQGRGLAVPPREHPHRGRPQAHPELPRHVNLSEEETTFREIQ